MKRVDDIFVDEESIEWRKHLADKFKGFARKKEETVVLPKVKVSKSDKITIYESLLEEYKKYDGMVFANQYAIKKNERRKKVYSSVLSSMKSELKIKDDNTFLVVPLNQEIIIYQTMLRDYGSMLLSDKKYEEEEAIVYSAILESLDKDIKKKKVVSYSSMLEDLDKKSKKKR